MRSTVVLGITAVGLAALGVVSRNDLRRLERRFPPSKLRKDVHYQRSRGYRWVGLYGSVFCAVLFVISLVAAMVD